MPMRFVEKAGYPANAIRKNRFVADGFYTPDKIVKYEKL